MRASALASGLALVLLSGCFTASVWYRDGGEYVLYGETPAAVRLLLTPLSIFLDCLSFPYQAYLGSAVFSMALNDGELPTNFPTYSEFESQIDPTCPLVD